MNAIAARLGLDALRQRAAAWLQRGRAQGQAVPVRDWINVSSGQPAKLLGFDQTLIWVVVALVGLGLVMVYSATVALPDNPRFARYSGTYFLVRHAMWVAVAVVAAVVAVQVPMEGR